jgi:hypothetical protein
MKAVIATDVIFIIVLIGLFVGAGMIIFWKWYANQKMIANEVNCRLKQQSYCLDVINGKQPNWDDVPPKSGCETYKIFPPTEEECKKLI